VLVKGIPTNSLCKLVIPLNFGAHLISVQMLVLLTRFIQVSTTVDSREAANKISRELLGERLASCVQVLGPIDSRYWWKGRIKHAREWMCLAKARAGDYRKIEAAIKQVHPYEIPEILALPIVYGNSSYLRWIEIETTPKSRPKT
jgi:periplasmic divalent cation tolerance protein